MIDDELYPPMGMPIQMRLRKGVFYAEIPNLGEVICNTIEGRFAGIVNIRFKGFPYYALQVKDDTNTIQVLFVPKASNLKDIVLSMGGETFINVFMQAHTGRDGRSKIRLYLDNEIMFPHYDERLPPIKRVRDGKGKPYYCLYGDRLKKIAEIIDMINKDNHIQPVGVMLH